MSDTRTVLAKLLCEHHAHLPNDGYPADEYECCADAILSMFYVVHRSDVVGTEYGYRFAETGEAPVSTAVCDLDTAAAFVRHLRRVQTETTWDLNAELLSRPVLPWSPTPLLENGEPHA